MENRLTTAIMGGDPRVKYVVATSETPLASQGRRTGALRACAMRRNGSFFRDGGFEFVSISAIDSESHARVLRGAAMDRLFADWIRSQVPFRVLIPVGSEQISAAATWVAGKDSTWTLEWNAAVSGPEIIEAGCLLHFHVNLKEGPCAFDATVLQGARLGKREKVHVQRPKEILTFDRRRSARRMLQEPAEVVLRTIEPADGWECTAAMLNVSPEGLACRLPRSSASGLSIGRRVRAAFRLGRPPKDFSVAGRITNITIGGTPDSTILGIGFLHAEEVPSKRQARDVADELRSLLRIAS